MADTTSVQSYVYTFKLVSGYNVITLPGNVIIENLKKIIIRKLGYNFSELGQYVAKLSIMGYDIHKYTDGIVEFSYTLSFFNSSGMQNKTIDYVNSTDKSDINLVYGNNFSQFTLVFDIDGPSSTGQPDAGMSNGGSPFVTTTNPLFLEIEFIAV